MYRYWLLTALPTLYRQNFKGRLRTHLGLNMSLEGLEGTIKETTGITIEDIYKIQPFKDEFSTAWFLIFVVFLLAMAFLIVVAFAYPLLECLSCSKATSERKNHDSRCQITDETKM